MSENKKTFKQASPWRFKRYYMYAFATVVSLLLPWITIDSNHFFLLSFDKLQLHLLFVAFDMQELYLLPFLLMLLFLGIFGMTVLGGRVFCGWICPQTIFRVVYRDFIETKILGLRGRIKNKQKEPNMSLMKNKLKKVVAIGLAILLGAVAASDFLWFFVPPEDFFRYIMNPSEHLILVLSIAGMTAFLVYDIIVLQENFCIYVCPYSRIQSVLYDEHTVMALYNPHRGGEIYDEKHRKNFTKQKDLQAFTPQAECTTCESCVSVCPTHIDIRKGFQLECINCLECVDACTTVMGKLNKPSLITWSSDYEIIEEKGRTHYFRPKVLGYMALFLGISIVLGIMGSKKEHMLLNINKETRLYSMKKLPNGTIRVDNSYEFLLQNTQNVEQKYYFEIIAPKNLQGKIYIAKPSKAFNVVPGIRKKKIVTLRTVDRLVKNADKDTIIPIQIHAFALDENGTKSEKISVFKSSTFTFPKNKLLEKL